MSNSHRPLNPRANHPRQATLFAVSATVRAERRHEQQSGDKLLSSMPYHLINRCGDGPVIAKAEAVATRHAVGRAPRRFPTMKRFP